MKKFVFCPRSANRHEFHNESENSFVGCQLGAHYNRGWLISHPALTVEEEQIQKDIIKHIVERVFSQITFADLIDAGLFVVEHGDLCKARQVEQQRTNAYDQNGDERFVAGGQVERFQWIANDQIPFGCRRDRKFSGLAFPH